MSWQDYVEAAQGLGFKQVTIINRANYQTVAYSSAKDIATAYHEQDEANLMNEDTIKVIECISRQYMKNQHLPHIVKIIKEFYEKLYSKIAINENQELLDDWKDKNKKTFNFYGRKYNIILRDNDDGKCIVGGKGNKVCIGYQFKSIWFIAAGDCLTNEEIRQVHPPIGFKNAAHAWIEIQRDIFDNLEEAGI